MALRLHLSPKSVVFQFQRGPALRFVSTGEELTLQVALFWVSNTFTQSPVTGAVIDLLFDYPITLEFLLR